MPPIEQESGAASPAAANPSWAEALRPRLCGAGAVTRRNQESSGGSSKRATTMDVDNVSSGIEELDQKLKQIGSNLSSTQIQAKKGGSPSRSGRLSPLIPSQDLGGMRL